MEASHYVKITSHFHAIFHIICDTLQKRVGSFGG